MAEALRTLIVDDEPAAVRRLTRLCEGSPTVKVVATAGGGYEAVGILGRTAVDLILLDIEMPGMSGLQLAERLVGRRPAPAVVFVTAFERFAISAFAVDAAGYLLKPVDPDMLHATLERVSRRVSADTAPPVFWAPHRGHLLRLEGDDIDRITGEDDYARLHCGDRSYLVAERLYAIEERLGGDRFIRIHRSALVNRDRIVGMQSAAGGWNVLLQSGESITIGRSYLSNVRETLGLNS